MTILEKSRAHFGNGPGLDLYHSDVAPSLVAGRAFLYAVALQAYLDIAAITLDEKWLLAADDLATTAAELFAKESYVKECPPDADLLGLPIADTAMLFDESTAGLLAMAGTRLAALNRPFLENLESSVGALPTGAIRVPILYTDIVQAALLEAYSTTYLFDSEIPDETRNKLSRMPLKAFGRGIHVRSGNQALSPQPGGVIRIGPDKLPVEVKDLGKPGDTSLRSAPK